MFIPDLILTDKQYPYQKDDAEYYPNPNIQVPGLQSP
jgi:hypothetical protein